MSYILDAINKSENERRRQAVTSLVAPRSEFRARRDRAPRTAVWLMSGSLLIASAAGGALFATGWGRDANTGIDTGPFSELQPAPSDTLTSSVSQAPAGVEPQPAVAEEPMTPTQPEVLPTESSPAPALGLLEIWQLTEAEQRYLAALNVSMHVFSTDPSQRTVIVNGLRAREGQSLGQDLRLLEITPDGLIVDFQGQAVHLATLNAS